MLEKKAVPHATYIVDKRRVNTKYIKKKKASALLSRSWPAIAELADAFAPCSLSAVSLELLQII
jgi:hypothetical protein